MRKRSSGNTCHGSFLAIVPIALSLLFLPALSRAQQIVAIPPDDARLFHALFLNSVAQKAIAVNAADAVKVVALSGTAAQRLAGLEMQHQAYLALVQSKKKTPHPAALQGFAAQQSVLDWRGINDLRQGLSPQGWQQLRTWSNGPFRDSVNAGTTLLEGN
jgi:hypothetical protein